MPAVFVRPLRVRQRHHHCVGDSTGYMNRKPERPGMSLLRNCDGYCAVAPIAGIGHPFRSNCVLREAMRYDAFDGPHVCVGDRFVIRTRCVRQVLRVLDV